MSSVYATEPATAGRVIFETTHGPLEIHLWCRECPQTTRLFLQLCLDGFYDNLVFHRIVSNFLIQTGALRQQQQNDINNNASLLSAMTNNKEAVASYRRDVQASQALDRRSYETSSRIRFNHRGQVAMALGVNDMDDVEDLQPQFFITLEDAPYLDGKHVIFGTVSGPTIFNAMRIGRTETDETTHQPVDMQNNATRVKAVKIVDNPLHQGLTPHPIPPWRQQQQQQAKNDITDSNKHQKKKKKKRKGKFDTNVLSFGTEFDEEDTTGGSKAAAKKKTGMQSSHDLVESKVLSKSVDKKVIDAVTHRKDENENAADDDNNNNKNKDRESSKDKKDKSSKVKNRSSGRDSEGIDDEEMDPPGPAIEFSSRKKRKAENQEEDSRTSIRHSRKKISKKEDDDEVDDYESASKQQQQQQQQQQLKESLVESRRAKYTRGKKSKREREEETLNKLMAFKSTLSAAVEERKSTKSGSSSLLKAEKKSTPDDSLASRMARKAETSTSGTDAKTAAAAELAPTYHGQVLDHSGDEDGEEDNNNPQDGERKNKWLGTSFKCKRHVDHDSRDLGGGGGADGRDVDDYEVIDSKRGRGSHHRDRRNNHRRRRDDRKRHKHKHH